MANLVYMEYADSHIRSATAQAKLPSGAFTDYSVVANFPVENCLTAPVQNPVKITIPEAPADTAINIQLDLGSAKDFDVFVLAGHNLSATASVKIYGGASQYPAGLIATMVYRRSTMYYRFGSTQSVRYIQIEIDDADNSEDYISVGLMMAGEQIAPSLTFNEGWVQEDQAVNVTNQGTFITPISRNLYDRQKLTLPFQNITATVSADLVTMYNAMNQDVVPLLFIPDPDDYYGFVGRMNSGMSRTYAHSSSGSAVGDDLVNVEIVFIEDALPILLEGAGLGVLTPIDTSNADWAVIQNIETDGNGNVVSVASVDIAAGGTFTGAVVHTLGTVINESGADSDTRIEGDTEVNLLYVDASTDRVGIGTATPTAKVMINGTSDINQFLVQGNSTQTSDIIVIENSAGTDLVTVSNAGTIGAVSASFDKGIAINEGGNDTDTKIKGNTDANLFYVDAGNDRVGFGTSTPVTKSHILGANNTSWGNLTIESSDNDRSAFTLKTKAVVADSRNWGLASNDLEFGDLNIEQSTSNAGGVATSRMYFDIDGKVGIGTVTPAQELDVTGDINCSGELTAGTKTFKIDHPIDPENKILYHTAIEGPRVDLIYRGTAQLVKGKVTINLDKDSTVHPMLAGTFVALTQNAKVTSLQAENSFDRVKCSLVTGNSFAIESENIASTDTVNWVVMAERADKFIKSTKITDADGRMIPEHEKELPDLSRLEPEERETEEEAKVDTVENEPVGMKGKGYYIHNEAFGKALPVKKISYVAKPEPIAEEPVKPIVEEPIEKPVEETK